MILHPFYYVVTEECLDIKHTEVRPGQVDHYKYAEIELDTMGTHTMPLKVINRDFGLVHSVDSIRSVIIIF